MLISEVNKAPFVLPVKSLVFFLEDVGKPENFHYTVTRVTNSFDVFPHSKFADRGRSWGIVTSVTSCCVNFTAVDYVYN